MEIFDKALEFYKTSERLSEPEAILKAREVERLSEAGFQVLSIKSEDVSEWDTDAYVETGYPEWAALTECIIGFEVNGKQGQVSALWSDEVNYYGDLKDKLTFVDVQSYDGNSVVRHADTIQYLLKNDPAILSSLTKAITDHKGMHEDRIITVTPSEVVDVYQVTVTNGREDIILDVRAGLDQRGETEVWRVRDSGDRPVFVAEQYRGAAEYNSRHGHLEEAPLLSLTTDDLKVAITPLHQAAHPEVAEWRKEEERCAIEGRPYYGYGNVGAPAREFFEVFRMASVGEGEGTDLGIDVPRTEDYRSRVAIDGSDTEKDNYFRLLIDISSEGEPILTIYDGDPDGELSKEIFETHYDRIKEATAQYVAKIQQGADEIPFDSIADDEVREVADTLQGNDAVMAQLLVDDDENDPVPYKDEATAEHKYAHPNYGGSESPDYEFFDVFRTAGQEEGVYSIDVPLPKSARELFEDEPESHVPSDPNRNFYRLEITIGEDGHPSLVRDGSEGDGLNEHLYDVYNSSIRAGAETFAREHGLIADASVDADWDENDPVPHDTVYQNPANAEWADFQETAKAPPEGISLREIDGQMVASVVVPQDLLKAFDAETLDELGVHFDDQNRVELQLKTVGGEVRLDPHFVPDSYQDRFEVDLFDHHRDGLQQESDRISAEAQAAKAKTENDITVVGHSDFADSDPLKHHLDVRVDGETFTVIATFNESGKVADIGVDPDQDGFDPAMDGGNRYRELCGKLETVKDAVALRVQQYHDNLDERILQDTGWENSRTLEAGYAVIPTSEIDSIGIDDDVPGSYLASGDFRTAEGYPIRLDFDIDANLKAAVIPGTKVTLNPVLEGSRNHYVEAKAHLADHGIVLSKADSGDYRVDYHNSSSSYREGERGSAQFADTVSGATEIGHKMAGERAQQTSSRFQYDDRSERQAA